jgi:hypothetical protein
MGEIFQKRTLSGWIPADAPSEAEWRKQKLGEVYRAKVAKPRNYKHHCLFMVLLNELTFPNQRRYENDQDFRRAVAYEAGHVREFVTLDGEVHRYPLPYDYEHLPDEADFTAQFGKAMAVCASILRHTCPDLEDEVARYASENYQVECPRIFREDVRERAA